MSSRYAKQTYFFFTITDIVIQRRHSESIPYVDLLDLVGRFDSLKFERWMRKVILDAMTVPYGSVWVSGHQHIIPVSHNLSRTFGISPCREMSSLIAYGACVISCCIMSNCLYNISNGVISLPDSQHDHIRIRL